MVVAIIFILYYTKGMGYLCCDMVCRVGACLYSEKYYVQNDLAACTRPDSRDPL